MSSNLVLVLGGTRSGKSEFAESILQKLGKKITYIATAACLDEEMVRRVKKHRESRPKEWQTVEETQAVDKVLKQVITQSDGILLDCLTLLVSNLLFAKEIKDPTETEKRVLAEIEKIAILAQKSSCPVIVVSSEIGLGVVPDNFLARLYRDILGKANQIIAQKAGKVYLVVAGIPVELKALNAQLKERIESNED